MLDELLPLEEKRTVLDDEMELLLLNELGLLPLDGLLTLDELLDELDVLASVLELLLLEPLLLELLEDVMPTVLELLEFEEELEVIPSVLLEDEEEEELEVIPSVLSEDDDEDEFIELLLKEEELLGNAHVEEEEDNDESETDDEDEDELSLGISFTDTLVTEDMPEGTETTIIRGEFDTATKVLTKVPTE